MSAQPTQPARNCRFSRADGVTTSRFLDRLQIASIGASMGAVETLVQQPAALAHAELTSEERAAIGAYDDLVRLSVGLGHVDDLIADLEQALAAAFTAG